jgi:alpha-tubulin suppressor-like RCC1 family protein
MRSSPIQVGTGFYRTLALGNNSTMAIDPYGTLSAWGENLYGQIGTNNVTSYSWTQLSNGDAHSLALRSDGTLYAWGLNSSGQLGTSDTVARQSPIQINANIGGVVTSNWTSVSAGASHSVAIASDGIAYGWGLNTSGQVGDITVVSRSAPVQIGIAGIPLNYSAQFNGVDYLSLNTATMNIGTNAFTIEAWVYVTSMPDTAQGIFGASTISSNGFGIAVLSTNQTNWRLFVGNGSTWTINSQVVDWTNKYNTWTHFAISRTGGTLYFFLNGVLTYSVANATNIPSTFFAVGAQVRSGFRFNGYISNFRVLIGSGLYTTSFTPSVSPFSNIANTVLLTCNGPTIIDSSSNNLTITNTGSVTVSISVNPFIYYSGSFNGTNQSIQVANSGGILDFGTGNFTIEMWVYATSSVVGAQPFVYGNYANGASLPYFGISGSGSLLRVVYSTTGTTSNSYMTGPSWNLNTWYHVAIVRVSNTVTWYVNGTSYSTWDVTGIDFTGMSGIRIGSGDVQNSSWSPNYYFPGYVSNFRAVKGTAVYTGNFTTPTNILRTIQSSGTNISALSGSETVLLTCQNSTFIDNSTNAFTITNNGSSTISSTIAPFQASAPAGGTGYFVASKVSAGKDYTLAIKTDNTLYSWGLNTSYQLGSGTTVPRSSPVQVGTSSWSLISAGAVHALAIDINNLLYGWGTQTSGQLGLGDTALRSQPTQIGASSWVAISAGYSHSIALRSDNQLFTWGNNTNGQLGFNRSFISIGAGNTITSVIRSDGTLWTWGFGTSGQLGDNTAATKSSPVAVGLLTNWSKTTRPSYTNYAIDTTNKLYAWGENTIGAIGDSTTVNKSSPVQIGNSSWTIVATSTTGTAGQQTAYAIRSDGALFVWGSNLSGQLGTNNPPNLNLSSPVQIGTSSWSVVSGGNLFAMAITSDGKLYGWGQNNTGQLGIIPSTFTWSKIASSGLHTLAIRSDNKLYAWGDNVGGKLGDGTTVNKSSPVFIASNSYTQISAGLSNSYAIRSDGSLWAWGDNTSGQLGDPTIATTTARSSPVQLGSDSWSLVSASQTLNYVLATRSDNTLYGWGLNTSYQLGNSTTITRSSPVQVSGGGSWTAVSVGGGHALAVKTDYKLYAWGLNNIGQTANNGTSISWSKITATKQSTLQGVFGIRNDGSLWVWGSNQSGQLGLGDTVTRSSPVQLGTSSWVSVVAGSQNQTFAIRNDGALFAWGLNNAGQLGDVSTVSRSSPVQIGTSSWTTISAGFSHGAAITTDGKLYTWGGNTYGALGDFTPTTVAGFRSSPVQVGTSSWTSISVGEFHALAIRTDGTLWVWGYNAAGQLGINSPVGAHRSQPVQLSTSSWSQVDAMANGSIGITSGKLFTWGANGTGVLGQNDVIFRSSPVQVGSSSWSLVFSSQRNQVVVHGITISGTLWAWGFNGSGNLGDSSVLNRSAPVQIGAATNWTTTGGGFAINNTGQLWGWSYNVDWQLGQGDTAYRSSPVQVGTNTELLLTAPAIIGASSWTSVSAGSSHSMAIRIDGGLFAWGLNNNGQLGLTNINAAGDTTNRSSPVQVGTSSWTVVSAGASHTVALKYPDNSLFTWGLNTSGQLGSGVLTARSSPVQVGTPVTTGYTTLYTSTSTYLTFPSITVGTSAYTAEMWFYLTDGTFPGQRGLIGPSTRVNNAFNLRLNTATTINIDQYVSSAQTFTVPTMLANTWYHFVAVRNASNVTTVFLNGVRSSTGAVTMANNYSGAFNQLGGILDAGPIFLPGYISNFRMVIGTAVYDPTLTTLTVPTTPLTAVAGTVLLTSQNATLIDNSTNNSTITNNGGVSITPFSPFAGSGLYSALIAGANYSAGLDTGNNLYTWGLGTSGQIGDSTAVTKSLVTKIGTLVATVEYSPVQVGNDSWSQVSAGASHTAGIKLDSTVFAWGLNSSGQLGDGTVVSRSSPVQVGTIATTLSNANAYSLQFNGASQSLSIPNNSAFTMSTGDFTFETYLYNSKVSWVSVPIFGNSVSGQSRIYTDSGGFLHLYNNDASMNIATTGTLASLGMSLNIWIHIAVVRISGVLKFYFNGVSAPLTFSTGTGAESVDFINSTIGYVGTGPGSGSAYLNGYLSNLRLVKGTGVYTNNFSVSTTPLTAISGTSLLTAQNTTIVDNSTNAFTVTNNNSVSYSLNTPFTSAVAVGAIFATQISAGGTHSVAIDTQNKLYGWGLNSSGQLALNDTANRSAPVQVGLLNNWNTISAGADHTIALDSVGTLYAWGLGTTGQLGDITAISKSSPVLITAISIPNTSSPIQVGTSSYTIISAGNNFSAALSSTNKLFVWGLGTTGQLGTGNTLSRSSPVQISANSYNLVNAGGTHTTFVPNYSPQLILATGLNSQGQLGLSDIISRSSPTQVAASTSSFNSPVTVSTGNYSSYYVSSPTQVGTSSWTAVSAGGTHTLGIKKDNTLYAWGYNANGQLGGSNTINRSSPVQVGTSSWSQVSAGDSHNIILKSDGTINTFGLNTFGQLGDGT